MTNLLENRKSGFRIAAAACLPGLVLLLLSCGVLFEKPTFTLKEITVQPVSLKEMNFLLGVEARNPNGYDLELKSLEFKFYLDDREVGKGRLQREVRIPKDCTSDLRIPITASYGLVGDYLKAALGGREIRYKLAGDAVIKAGPGSSTVPFSKEGTINPKAR